MKKLLEYSIQSAFKDIFSHGQVWRGFGSKRWSSYTKQNHKTCAAAAKSPHGKTEKEAARWVSIEIGEVNEKSRSVDIHFNLRNIDIQ